MKKNITRNFCVLWCLISLFAYGCDIVTNQNTADIVWLHGDIVPDTHIGPVDISVKDEGSWDVKAQDSPSEIVGPKADVAETDVAAEIAESEVACVPDCEGKVCGPDGCGAVCGSCINQNACDEASGQCIEDPPNCAGKECGPDGLGGLCGVCQEPAYCNDYGMCVSPPQECDYCVEPYSSCVKIDNIWNCVECSDDTGCPEGGYCDLTYYSCKIPPPEGAGLCDAETTCIESDSIDFNLACEPDNQLCFDQFGWCDDVYARCRPGSQCLILQSVPNALIGPDPAIYPPGGGPGTVGFCSCQNPVDTTELMPCLLNRAEPCVPSLECPGTQQCLAPGFASGSFPMPPTASGVCVDVSKMMGSM